MTTIQEFFVLWYTEYAFTFWLTAGIVVLLIPMLFWDWYREQVVTFAAEHGIAILKVGGIGLIVGAVLALLFSLGIGLMHPDADFVLMKENFWDFLIDVLSIGWIQLTEVWFIAAWDWIVGLFGDE
ncbi:hypothetical protein LCGC14_0176100 [marine sediment metagenome]|uniref:Uncharacterized protein n=1 Tax=marine sediment metagenome TaxID=412755 RepID=A0A0F9X9S8_9ZZZZ